MIRYTQLFSGCRSSSQKFDLSLLISKSWGEPHLKNFFCLSLLLLQTVGGLPLPAKILRRWVSENCPDRGFPMSAQEQEQEKKVWFLLKILSILGKPLCLAQLWRTLNPQKSSKYLLTNPQNLQNTIFNINLPFI